jgi:hypothetical protein
MSYEATVIVKLAVESFQFYAGVQAMRAFSLTMATQGIEGVANLNGMFQICMIAALLGGTYLSRHFKTVMMNTEEASEFDLPLGFDCPTEATAVRMVYDGQVFYLKLMKENGRVIQAVFVRSDSGLVQLSEYTSIRPEAVEHLVALKNPEALNNMLGACIDGKWMPSGISMRAQIALAASLTTNNISNMICVAYLLVV